MTIYTITYNEEIMLPHFIRHYRDRFPGCRIIVYDNYSTDSTRTIAYSAGCEVILYDTNNQLDDRKYLEIKNHCWKRQTDDWCIVADCDEFLDINHIELNLEDQKLVTIIRSQGYDMVNMANNLDIHNITHVVENMRYSKAYCFNTKAIREINYSFGAHDCVPDGRIKPSEKAYPAYHYRYVSPAYIYRRYNQNRIRMCDNNKKHGMGSQYFQNEQQVVSEFATLRSKAKPLREPQPLHGLKIYVTYFQHDQLFRVPPVAHLTAVDLSKLPLGKLQDNRLSEHRLFLSDISDHEQCEYLGNLTWRWWQKNRHMISQENIWQLYRSPEVVWAAWPDDNWYRKSCIDHKGLQKYLDELIEFTGLNAEGTGLLANQFICHNEVWRDFVAFFRKCFNHFHAKYGYEFYFEMLDKYKTNYQPRLAALFYERIAALYFANRKDLIIKQIPNR